MELLQIGQYTKAEWGEAQAKRYLEDLRRQIDFAAQFPGIGSEAIGLPREYRKIRSGAHRAIYRCTDTELVVVRVIHEREDGPDEIEDFW
jgi:toxin ParE1/3/4